MWSFGSWTGGDRGCASDLSRRRGRPIFAVGLLSFGFACSSGPAWAEYRGDVGDMIEISVARRRYRRPVTF
jgi:hypothetical protein